MAFDRINTSMIKCTSIDINCTDKCFTPLGQVPHRYDGLFLTNFASLSASRTLDLLGIIAGMGCVVSSGITLVVRGFSFRNATT